MFLKRLLREITVCFTWIIKTNSYCSSHSCLIFNRQYAILFLPFLEILLYLHIYVCFGGYYGHSFSLDSDYSVFPPIANIYTLLTLNLTSCKFYLILMSLSPIYDPHPPAHTESSPPRRRQFHHSLKNWLLGRFPLPFGLQTTYGIVKNRFRKLFSRRFWTYL
jgi:hypothetical protein